MVRLINKHNIKFISNFTFKLLKFQEKFTHIKNINYPDIDSCVYVLWHENQFLVHGFHDREKVNILISTSLDGDIVANVCHDWGYKVQRGSAGRKGAIASSLKMIDNLKNNEKVAIMVDGPRGPYHEVKKGAIVLAKEANVPLIPVHWYSGESTFASFPSWDKMRCPVGPCKIINLYGDPIYTDNKSDEELAKEIKDSLLHLEKIAPHIYEDAKKNNLWKQNM